MRLSSPSASAFSSHLSRALFSRCSGFTFACMWFSLVRSGIRGQSPNSLHRNSCRLDDLAPLVRFALHVRGKLARRAGDRLEVVRREEFLAEVRVGQHAL